MDEIKFIGSRLDERMKALGYSDESLAEKTGIGKTTIYYLRVGRKGKQGSTSAEKLAIIAATLLTNPEYFVDESASPSPNQKKMSALIADIVAVASTLSPAKQRQLRELGAALARLDRSNNVEEVYSELMDLITRLEELDGGDKAITDLARYLNSLTPGSAPAPVARPTRDRRRRTGKTPEEPAQSGK